MLRTQIQLEDEQAEALRGLAAARGVSLAALIREAVGAMLESGGRNVRVVRALTAAGAFSSGRRDVSVRHDEHLAEAYRA